MRRIGTAVDDFCSTCSNYKPIVKEPEYEWVDCTGEWDFRYNGAELMATNRTNGCLMAVAPRKYYGLDLVNAWNGPYRMVEDSKSFRIERRVEKKPAPPVFKVGDKVRYDGRKWTIKGWDGCTPPCARLEEDHETAVVPTSRLEAVK